MSINIRLSIVFLCGCFMYLGAMDKDYSVIERPIAEEQWCDGIKWGCIGVSRVQNRAELNRHVEQTMLLNRRAEKYITLFSYRGDLQALCAEYTLAAVQRILELEYPEYLVARKKHVYDLRALPVRTVKRYATHKDRVPSRRVVSVVQEG